MVAGAPVSAQSPSDDAAALAELRALQAEVASAAAEAEAARAQLRTAAAQRSAQVEQLQVRRQVLLGERDALLAQQTRLTAAVEGSAAPVEVADPHRPLFDEAYRLASDWIDGSLAFRAGDRRARLESIRDALEAGTTSSVGALARLWTFLSDEHRLCTEYGLDRQPVEWHGEPRLADVARIGMVMMVVRFGDGEVGAILPGDGVRVRPLTDAASVRAIQTLFDTLASSGVPDVALVPAWLLQEAP
jgi:hypothetical protein